jgi:hypothetical protein
MFAAFASGSEIRVISTKKPTRLARCPENMAARKVGSGIKAVRMQQAGSSLRQASGHRR